MTTSDPSLQALERAIGELERATQNLIAHQRLRRVRARESLDQVSKALDQITARINAPRPPESLTER